MYLLTICGQSLGVLSKGKKRNKPISYLRYMNAKKEVMLFLKGVQNHQIRLKQFCSSQKYLHFQNERE